jgi:hypothetical protein
MRRSIVMMTMLIAVLAAFGHARAEVSVSAEVDRTTLAPGESLQLQVTVNGGKGDVDLSGLNDFKVLSTGTSSSIQIVNGHMSRQQTYTYVLMARHKGRLTIPALPVDVDGQIYRSEPITVTVSNQPDTGSGAGSSAQGQEAWVTAEVSNPTPYEGQQMTYIFRLYNSVQIDDAKFQPPEFDGFSSKEIKDRRSFRKLINGREVVATEIDYVLTPLKAGEQTIEPAVLQVSIVRPSRSRQRSPFGNFFNDPFFSPSTVEPRVLQTDALQVKVQPLPALPANLKFSGLVGRFDLHVDMAAADLKVGDSATLSVTVEGRGNIMDAQPPALKIPSDFKAYADNPQEAVEMDRDGFHGKKIFRTALVPLKAGRFELPAVSLTYFDPEQKAYRTLTASAPALTVAASLEKPAPVISIAPQPLQPVKKQVTFTGRDILPPKENLTAVQSRQPLSWVLFFLALAVPPLVFGATVMIQRLSRQDTRPAAVMSAKARRTLRAASKRPADAFLTLLYQALTAAILAAAGRIGETLTWKEAESLLLGSGRSAEEAHQAAELLANIESSKFSGRSLSDSEREALLAQTRQTMRKLIP